MSNYLKLARQAREENNSEDAKKFYDMVRTEDPENVEAKYYYAFYNLEAAINRDVPNKFDNYIKTADGIVKRLKESSLTEEEKLELLGDIVESHIYLTYSTTLHIRKNISIYMNIFESANNSAVTSVVEMGNSITNAFKDNKKALDLAVKCWKSIFTKDNWNQWYYNRIAGNREESAKKWNELISKIQEVDPSFVAPQKPKAESCGTK